MGHLAVVVDKDDNILGHKDRFNLEKGDIIRISLLWLENSKGEVLLAQRSHKKEQDPELWGPAAGGTVEIEETYESNIYKEAEEEIGLTGVKLEEFTKDFFWRPDGVGRFATWFRAKVDWPAEKFKLQKSEVDAVAWLPKDKIREELRINPSKYAASATHWSELGFI
jgi:8-oxo-dGTP pyrophosphatase MutT (NUDIX family)